MQADASSLAQPEIIGVPTNSEGVLLCVLKTVGSHTPGGGKHTCYEDHFLLMRILYSDN
jgi:hypothetical protein